MDNTDANKILARDDITDEQRQIALNFKDGIASIKEFKALKLDLDKLDKIKAIEDEDERHNQYMDYINDKNAASYAKNVLYKSTYSCLDTLLIDVSNKYLGDDNYDEYFNHRHELQSIVYKDLRQSLINYMEADTDKIIFKIPKCVLKDLLYRAFNSPDGEHDPDGYDYSKLQEELDNMDSDNEDNYEFIELDIPRYISYNPGYWLPETYHEFMSLICYMED